MFDDDVVNFAEQRVFGIGAEHFFVAIGIGGQQTGVFESVEFESDTIG